MSRPTWDTSRLLQDFTYRAITVSGQTFQTVPLSIRIPYRGPATPLRKRNGLGIIPVRSPLLRESLLFSFPQATEMFHFAWCRSEALCIQTPVSSHYGRWVSPFGNPRIIACLPLPEAYRSLPRPSSPTDAKASIVCSYMLDRNSVSQQFFVCSPPKRKAPRTRK